MNKIERLHIHFDLKRKFSIKILKVNLALVFQDLKSSKSSDK